MDLHASLEQERHVLRGGSRAVVISAGPAGLAYPAYALRDAAALDILAARLARFKNPRRLARLIPLRPR